MYNFNEKASKASTFVPYTVRSSNLPSTLLKY